MLVFQIIEKRPSQVLSFKEARLMVLADLKREKAREVCQEKARRLLEQARQADSPEKFFRRKGFRITEKERRRKELFTGHLPEIIGRALSEKAEPGLLDKPLCDQIGCYLVWIKEIKPADFSDWEKEKKVLFHVLTQEKRTALFRAWYQDLREKAEIKLYQKLP